MEDLWCKIYLRPKVPPNDLRDVIAQLVSGSPTNVRSVETRTLSIDVMQNRAGSYVSDDFVEWPFHLDIEPANAEVGRPEFVSEVRALLQGLHERTVDAVPACSFEDELR
jgi:hypothetical protein